MGKYKVPKSLKSEYPDGFYTIVNPHGVETDIEIKKGVVFIAKGGLGNGCTGTNLEHYMNDGFKITKGV